MSLFAFSLVAYGIVSLRIVAGLGGPASDMRGGWWGGIGWDCLQMTSY